jgi:predicted GTPase
VNLILIIGRTGAGKSSLLEDLTDSSGHSKQSIDAGEHLFLEKHSGCQSFF